MYDMKNNPNRYYQIINNYHEAQLLFTSIRMNVFSHLDAPITAQEIAGKLNCDKRKIELLLLSLVSCKIISKQGEYYANTSETKDFLSRNSEVFLGETILFREKMTSLDNLETKLKHDQMIQENNYDFAALAKMVIPEMYTGRVQAFIKEMKKLFPNPQKPLRILDLGGGTGILSIEFTKHFPKSKAFVFETPEVSITTKEIIEQYHADQVEVLTGNFNTDDIGGQYDLIIASGILNFVKGDLGIFMKKLANALNHGGHLLVIGQYADHNSHVPPNMVNWLSGFLDGIPLPPETDEWNAAMKEAGLLNHDLFDASNFKGQLFIKTKHQSPVQSEDVIHAFIELNEQIANGKTNILNFGSEDMTFYRGEIHMIKMIGDFPGIHSAKLARKFGITKPVVHKTLQKLTERGLIKKETDESDKKRFKLYLTKKGKNAYGFHKEYHDQQDKTLFTYLAHQNEDQLAAIKGFLEEGIALIKNHA